MNTSQFDYSEIRILNNRIKRARQLKRRITCIVISIILFIAALIIFKCSSSFAKDDSTETLYKYYKFVDIERGDTLESISLKYVEDGKNDLDSLMNEIIDINNIKNPDCIIAGKSIVVPYYDTYHG